MRVMMVRYTVKDEQVEANERLVREVFAELRSQATPGVRYATSKLEDGRTFVHIAAIDAPAGANPLTSLPAFKAFQAGIRERCSEPPVATELHPLESFGLFA
ncbi:MAG: hypothetical protein U1F43_25960 [Myxococcota bacterium]